MLLDLNEKIKKLKIEDRKEKEKKAYRVGETVLYCSNSSQKEKDRVGVIVRVTKECVWIESNKEEVTVRRHKRNVQVFQDL